MCGIRYLQEQEVPHRAGWRVIEVQARSTEGLDLTRRPLAELQRLLPPGEAACPAQMAAGRRAGQPRTACRWSVDPPGPCATPAERWFCLLTSLQTSALPVLQGRLRGRGQSKARPGRPGRDGTTQRPPPKPRWPRPTGIAGSTRSTRAPRAGAGRCGASASCCAPPPAAAALSSRWPTRRRLPGPPGGGGCRPGAAWRAGAPRARAACRLRTPASRHAPWNSHGPSRPCLPGGGGASLSTGASSAAGSAQPGAGGGRTAAVLWCWHAAGRCTTSGAGGPQGR
jgi:hypothetical protein